MRNKHPDDITIVVAVAGLLAIGALVGVLVIENALPEVVKILLNIGG